MAVRVPEPIAAYFAATSTHNVDAVLAGFADGAVVRGEGQEWRGRAAIREWMEETIRKYQLNAAVTNVTEGITRLEIIA